MRALALALFASVVCVSGLGNARPAVTRRLAIIGTLPAVFLGRLAAGAEEPAPPSPASCRSDCFKECNAVAPGNQGYCATQCDNFCDEVAKSPGTVETGLPPQADLDKNL
jgi:hypothetical protein